MTDQPSTDPVRQGSAQCGDRAADFQPLSYSSFAQRQARQNSWQSWLLPLLLVAAASLHVGATVDPSNFEGTWIAEPYVDGHYDAEHGIRLDGGWMDLPPGPGLGITPDESLWGDPVMSFT